jgi:hypothetical protein
MTGVMDLVGQLSQGDTLKNLSRQLGMDEDALGRGIATATPLLVTALAHNASNPAGAQQLTDALAAHDGSALDRLGNAGESPDTEDGARILGHVFGDRLEVARQTVAKTIGVNPDQASQLLATLAPLVMGAVGRLQRNEGLDASTLPQRLAGMRDGLQQHAPEMLAVARQLLDRNQDGSILDDVGGLVGKLFQKG